MSESIDVNTEQELFNKLSEVETALTSNHPALQLHLIKLHTFLKKQPELVHVLTDAQIGTMVGAYSKLTAASITEPNAAKGGTKRKTFSAAELGLFE